MAKHNCAICGAEIGLMSSQKLADGNYICRKTVAPEDSRNSISYTPTFRL